jgi:endoglycosylceramidase
MGPWSPLALRDYVAVMVLRRGSHRSTSAVLAVAILVVASSVTLGAPTAVVAAPAAPAAQVAHSGRWLTDGDGRALMTHGVNLVAKTPGQTPADMGFGADDAAFLVRNGFDTVRLGTTAASIMPTPGVIDQAYLDSFEQTVHQMTDAGLRVLIDLHQDGWGPTLGSDGFPDWMTLTHGAENTHTGFPLYYVTNPAIQAAFDSFWANEAGPGGVGLQDRVAAMFSAMATRFSGDPGVLGYDLINEPWPGTTWQPCANDPAGCPTQDKALAAYEARMTTAIRAKDPKAMIFAEPYVLFNFGNAPTTIGLPGGDIHSGLSYHVYTTDPKFDPAVVQYAEDWTKRTGGALLNTEFGATADVPTITRQVNLFDTTLSSWMWWAYNENFVKNGTPPANDDTPSPVIDALVRPHPRAVAGTPTALSFDAAARVMRFDYDASALVGGGSTAGLTTEFQVAHRTYRQGYKTKVIGGSVTSAADAPVLKVVADASASKVFVKVWPADQAEPPDRAVVAPPVTTTTAPAGTTSTSVPPRNATQPAPVAVAPSQAAAPVSGTSRFTG